jgi:hypothetical protein
VELKVPYVDKEIDVEKVNPSLVENEEPVAPLNDM